MESCFIRQRLFLIHFVLVFPKEFMNDELICTW